ncbi:MAG: IS1595 family transposase [Chloroflexi bacterium]|nr:IS1595 family transposase [Chloroflexota bacterium]
MPKKIERKTLTLSKIAKLYSDEEAAYLHLESIRWSNGVVCPHCGSVNHSYLLNPQNGERITRTGTKSYRRVWKCGECREQFSVLVGTVMEDSRIPLSKWLLAFHEMSADKNGISSHELARKLDITQKSAWHLAHRIRYASERPPLSDKLQGTVEADETYFGGKAKNMHKAKREREIQGRGTVGKTAVLAVVERGGEVRSQVVENVNDATVRPILKANVDPQAILNTDTSPVYNQVGKEFAKHETVDHGKEEYVRGTAHINTAEGHFSQLKRSIDGTHHHVSAKHLDRYLAEFDYRYTTRKQEDGLRTEELIKRAVGKRLTYRKPIENSETLVKPSSD